MDFRLSHHLNYFRVGNSGRAFGKIKFEVERKVRRRAAKKCKRTYVPASCRGSDQACFRMRTSV